MKINLKMKMIIREYLIVFWYTIHCSTGTTVVVANRRKILNLNKKNIIDEIISGRSQHDCSI